MLKGVDPVLTPDALYALAAMGHGDEVVLVDSHYPAELAGRLSGYGHVVRLDGADIPTAIRAVLSVTELDSFVEHPAERMMVDGEPETIPAVQQEAQAALDAAVGHSMPYALVDRKDFYERAKKAYCVAITGETRGWGCFIFRKGLTTTDDAPSSQGKSHISQGVPDHG